MVMGWWWWDDGDGVMVMGDNQWRWIIDDVVMGRRHSTSSSSIAVPRWKKYTSPPTSSFVMLRSFHRFLLLSLLVWVSHTSPMVCCTWTYTLPNDNLLNCICAVFRGVDVCDVMMSNGCRVCAVLSEYSHPLPPPQTHHCTSSQEGRLSNIAFWHSITPHCAKWFRVHLLAIVCDRQKGCFFCFCFVYPARKLLTYSQ